MSYLPWCSLSSANFVSVIDLVRFQSFIIFKYSIPFSFFYIWYSHCMDHSAFADALTVLDKLSNLGILFPGLTNIIINTKPVFIFVSVFHLQNLV